MDGLGTLSNYHELHQVGEGTYGYVYRARDKRFGTSVALKRMVLHKEHMGFPLCAIREIKFLKSLKHRNIVSLLDIATSKGCEHLDIAIREDSKNKQTAKERKEKEERDTDEAVIRRNAERDQTINMLSRCGSLYLVFEYVIDQKRIDMSMFRGLFLYAMVIISTIEWCIRKPLSYLTIP